jgi:hypothetical protein
MKNAARDERAPISRLDEQVASSFKTAFVTPATMP